MSSICTILNNEILKLIVVFKLVMIWTNQANLIRAIGGDLLILLNNQVAILIDTLSMAAVLIISQPKMDGTLE